MPDIETNVADSVATLRLTRRADLASEKNGTVPEAVGAKVAGQHEQLPEFFFRGHACEQVLHALVYGFSAGLAERGQAAGGKQQHEEDSHDWSDER